VRLTLVARRLLLVTWEISPAAAARTLPPGLSPALDEAGRALLSIAALRCEQVRLDGRRGPSFAQLSVRTYVQRAAEPAAFFLTVRVTPAGLGGIAFGAPLRPARIRVREGAVDARGLGVSFRYRLVGEPSDVPAFEAGPLGTHEVGYFVSAGLRRLVATHEPFDWRAAELVGGARAEPLLALGFDVGEPVSLLYAERTRFEMDLPPRKLADSDA
jgi:hypothetical protein